jgi:hypothetical protein
VEKVDTQRRSSARRRRFNIDRARALNHNHPVPVRLNSTYRSCP